jgi:hypothetical protein
MTNWVVVPEDLLTHLSDWEMACRIAADHEGDDYWQHQLRVIERIRRDIANKSADSYATSDAMRMNDDGGIDEITTARPRSGWLKRFWESLR